MGKMKDGSNGNPLGINGYDLTQARMGRQRVSVYYCAGCMWTGDPDAWPLHMKLTSHRLLTVRTLPSYSKRVERGLRKYGSGYDRWTDVDSDAERSDSRVGVVWKVFWISLVIIVLALAIGLGVLVWQQFHLPLGMWLG